MDREPASLGWMWSRVNDDMHRFMKEHLWLQDIQACGQFISKFCCFIFHCLFHVLSEDDLIANCWMFFVACKSVSASSSRDLVPGFLIALQIDSPVASSWSQCLPNLLSSVVSAYPWNGDQITIWTVEGKWGSNMSSVRCVIGVCQGLAYLPIKIHYTLVRRQ